MNSYFSFHGDIKLRTLFSTVTRTILEEAGSNCSSSETLSVMDKNKSPARLRIVNSDLGAVDFGMAMSRGNFRNQKATSNYLIIINFE